MARSVLPRWPGEVTERWVGELEDSIRLFQVSLTPASVGANTSAEETFAVTGIRDNDFIIVNGPTPTAATGIVNVRASARDQIAITFINTSAGGLSPASGTYTILAIRGQ